jgi:molybdenum cofactor biosynthesis enzyme MoaA
VPAAALPKWPCHYPWTHFEHNSNGVYGPCCADYLRDVERAPVGASPETLWNGAYLQAIRGAMTQPGHPPTCSRSCPVLASGSARPGGLVLRGGPRAAVDNQVAAVEAMMAGASTLSSVPLGLCLAVTSHCNYECIMCAVEDRGPNDQLAPEYYRALESWLDRLLVLDANGGEPLASSSFRRFLLEGPLDQHPHLKIHMTTNGSFFTADLERYARLPLSALTISLNAATPRTYQLVNRGLPWERIRSKLDALLEASRNGRLDCALRYSMVVLRQNLDEIVPFAEMAHADGVGVRYLLPTGNRNDTSIMTDAGSMRRALEALSRVRSELRGGNVEQDRHDLDGVLRVLEARLSEQRYDVL